MGSEIYDTLSIFGHYSSKLSSKRVKAATIGGILREKREAAKIPLRFVAESTGIDISLIAKIERDKRRPTRKQIQLLSSFFGIDERTIIRESVIDQMTRLVLNEKLDTGVLIAARKRINQIISTRDAR